IFVCIAGLEQSVGHGFFVDPPARNHPSKTEGHGIEHLITLADRGGTDFGGRALDRCCCISLAAQAAIRSRPGLLVHPFSVWLSVWADDACQPQRQFGYGVSLEGLGQRWPAINALPPLTVRQHGTWCNYEAARAAHVDAVRQLAAPVAKRLTFWLLEKQGSTAVRCFCYRHIGKVAAIRVHKPVEGFDAVIAVRMPIAVDDDEARTSDNDGRQSGGMSVPPLAYLLLFGARLFLPAD